MALLLLPLSRPELLGGGAASILVTVTVGAGAGAGLAVLMTVTAGLGVAVTVAVAVTVGSFASAAALAASSWAPDWPMAEPVAMRTKPPAQTRTLAPAGLQWRYLTHELRASRRVGGAGAVSGIGLDVTVPVSDLIRRLPGISIVRDRSCAMAMLDAILSPEWGDRYFSFDSRWSPTEEMASMRDGCGNEYSIVFSPAGAYARGFDHESPMTPYRVTPPAPWPGLFHGVPEAFRAQVEEPAFSDHGTPRATVCFWREQADTVWKAGAVEPLPEGVEDGGSVEWLFDVLLDGFPEAYQQFAEEYYEVPVGAAAVRHVYALRPLTQGVVSLLNPSVDIYGLAEDIAQIGYPVQE
ncbi:hypothetical protein [Streptomyces sp. NPDC001250]|uniref:hypothetical protein n=1 Tax=Streptomyces sp. NPDC001250 TaxID=3154382 RepID=UPI0033246CEE